MPAMRSLARSFVRLVTLHWWTWRLTRRLLFACAVLATLIAAVYVVENWRGRRAYAEIEREMAAVGISLRLADHTPPPVPDDRNLAKIPLLDAPAEPEARNRFFEDLNDRLSPRRAANAKPAFRPSLPVNHWPIVLQPHPGDAAAFRSAMRDLESGQGTESLADYRLRSAKLLGEFAAAAESRPYLSYEYKMDDLVAFMSRSGIPFGTLRHLSQAASCESLLALDERDPARAAVPARLIFRLGAALRAEPFPVTQMIAASVEQPATSVVWQGQLDHVWTRAELDAFSTVLAADRILPSLRRAFAAETAFAAPLLLCVSDKRLENASREFAVLRSLRWLPSGWVYQNAASVVRHHRDHTLRSIDADLGRIHPEVFADDKGGRGWSFSPYDFFGRMMTAQFKAVSLRAGQTKTTHDLARLAVALEKHLLAHGVYPDSLAPVLAADPALAALHDPFDGQPYRYRRDPDGGFTLWGIGQNLRDDGGTYPVIRGPLSADFATGDLVWRVPGR